MPIVLGVDPGLNITGYGIIEFNGKVRLIEAGVIRSGAGTLAERIKEIYDGLSDVITTFQPTEMALEELYSHYDRPKTAILMGHARGAICLVGAQAGLIVHSYAATKIKKMLTGSGHAAKDQIQRAIQLELHLSRIPEPPDVADALAIALCHCYHGKLK